MNVLVVCPLVFETRHLRRHLGRDRVRTIGVGAAAVEAWAAEADPSERLVILAGLAGALTPDLRPGTAHVVSAVRAADGRMFTPTHAAASACTITSAVEVLDTPAAKAACRAETGADLVDLESVRFAEIATDRQWSWAIVRGVSDAADETLPARTWTTPDGRTRAIRVAWSLVRGATSVTQLARLRRDSGRALDEVTRRVRELGAESD